MFMDEHRATFWDQLRQADLRMFGTILTKDVFHQAAEAAGLSIGLNPLNIVNLVWLSVALGVYHAQSYASVVTFTLKFLRDGELWPDHPVAKAEGAARRRRRGGKGKHTSKHDPRRDDPTVVSEEAFAKARQKMPAVFWGALLDVLIDRFEARHQDRVRFKRFRLLALDGTMINMDNRKTLADHYGLAKNGKGKGKTPQARMVMLQFPGARMPVAYEVAPSSDGERKVADPLLGKLRRDDLVLMDRGFWSFGAFCKIQSQQAYFGIRRFKSANLTTIRHLSGKDRLVWYQPSDPQWRKQQLPNRIPLRVIEYQMKGFRPSEVVTNVLDPKEISRAEWIQMAEVGEAGEVLQQTGVYHRRWEIEISFLELKEGQQMQRSLRGRTPASIEYEIAGQVLLYLMIRWTMVEAAQAHGVEDPLRLSFTQAYREITEMAPKLLASSVAHAEKVLLPRLLERVASHRVPLRPGRCYPRPNDKKSSKIKGKTPAKLTPCDSVKA